jgi:hypothetical protein
MTTLHSSKPFHFGEMIAENIVNADQRAVAEQLPAANNDS